MKTLDEIFIIHGTDKASTHPVKGHDYARHYDEVFSQLRSKPLRVMEIGVGGGESIRGWLEYFPNARVWGLDLVQGTNPWNTVNSFVDPRYEFIHGDQSSRQFLDRLVREGPKAMDIIIDDGSHYASDVISTMETLWPILQLGGFYCIEDLATAYGGPPFVNSPPSHMDFIRSKIDTMNKGLESEVDWIRLSCELAIFRKAGSYSLAS